MKIKFSVIAVLVFFLTVFMLSGPALAKRFEMKIGHSMPTDTTRH